jgi:LmbE family N-acetylglucosaminyl deacetylase
MELNKPGATIFIPDAAEADIALARVTHLGVGAHQDDLEIMAYHGMAECFHNPAGWFAGITCTDGAGSPRAGAYAPYSDEQMRGVRKHEQNKAAMLGEYTAMVQLDYPSSEVKVPPRSGLQDDLERLLRVMQPQVIYTHNPADRHDTHVGVMLSLIGAIRRMPADQRPRTIYGCEVWLDLDWLPEEDKIALDVSAHEGLAAALVGVFDSQVAGGKRYDLATLGRRRANATYYQSHQIDMADQLWFAMDLSPLAHNDSLNVIEYVGGLLDRFTQDVRERLETCCGSGD